MSEPTLYRHCKHEELPPEAEADLCNKCLPWLGMVPVEIDWPALWGVRSILSWESQPERVQEAFRWATLRALEIGDDDD